MKKEIISKLHSSFELAVNQNDDVEFWFPDGDNNTRTKLVGKKAVIDWWKNWKATSGIKSMTMDEAVFLPVNALKPTAGSKFIRLLWYLYIGG